MSARAATSTDARWLRMVDAAAHVGLSLSRFRSVWRRDAGLKRCASRPFGRIVLFDRVALDRLLEVRRLVGGRS